MRPEIFVSPLLPGRYVACHEGRLYHFGARQWARRTELNVPDAYAAQLTAPANRCSSNDYPDAVFRALITGEDSHDAR